jgi:hypothetical protein
LRDSVLGILSAEIWSLGIQSCCGQIITTARLTIYLLALLSFFEIKFSEIQKGQKCLGKNSNWHNQSAKITNFNKNGQNYDSKSFTFMKFC